MSGRSSTSFSPWRGRPRSRGSSRGALRGTSSSSSGPRRRSSRAQHSPRGRTIQRIRGTSSLVGPTRTSPIFSSPYVAPMPSAVDQESLSPTAHHGRGSTFRRHVPEASYQPYRFGINHSSSSSPSQWVDSQGRSLLPREATASAGWRDEIVLAVEIKEKNALGCAYYNTAESSLFLLHDLPCDEPLQLLETLMVHIEPTMVLLPLKIPDTVLCFFEDCRYIMDEGGVEKERYVLRTLGSNEFSHAASMERLANLPLIRSEQATVTTATGHRVLSDAVSGAQDECENIKAMRLGSFIDLESVLSISCAGAVLGQTIRMHNTGQAPHSADKTAVSCIQMFTLADFMFVNVDTLSSLQVFQPELHPNNLVCGTDRAGPGSKESLSLYGIFQSLAGTPQGKTKLRELFARPLINVDMIRERQRSIAVFLQADNAEVLRDISRALRKVKDIRKTLEYLQRGADAPTGGASVDRGVWWVLTQFSLHTLQLREAVLQLQDTRGVAVIRQLIDSTPVDVIMGVGELVGSVVDFEEAKASSRIAVRRNVSPELDTLKQTYHGLETLLSEVSTSLSHELPEWARHYVTGCVFWPQLGFLTVVSLRPHDGTPGYEGQGLHDDTWEKLFVANGHVYYKNRRMGELDGQLGDTYTRIVDLEIEILHDLASRVLENAPALSRASEACGELDCLVSLAIGAQKYRWTAPTMTTDNVVSIHGGRHPLQELAVPSFIANDCVLRGGPGDQPDRQTGPFGNVTEEVNTLIVTGPNHSGKSVYVKQVALIVYLARVGSFVPAGHATIGITDQILTRISTRESVSQKESAFGIDLRQVAYILKCATRRSLVVIDEFGKGTAADDGSGLMTGLVDHFTSLGSQTPKVLMTTHLHEVFENRCLQDRRGLSVARMDVRLDLNAPHMDDQVVFLYELVSGRSTSSFGSRCAALNGVDSAVVERAEAIVLLLARNEDLGAACARLNAEEEARLEEAENVARQFLQMSLAGTRCRQESRSGGDTGEFVRRTLGKLVAPGLFEERG